MLYGGAEPHLGLGMQKVERRACLDAVEQVEDCAASGGFTGLVDTDDEMEISCGLRKRQHPVGELAVPEQAELFDAH